MAQREDEHWPILIGLFVVSLVLHGLTFAALALAPRPSEAAIALAEVSFEVEEEEVVPEPEPEEPEPEPEEPEPEEPEPRAPPPQPEPEEQPEPEPPPPAEETPVDFSGVTLTNEGGDGSFAVQAGSGEERTGPIGPPGVPTGRRREGVPGGTPGGTGEPQAPRGPRIVGIADLSESPVPPQEELRRAVAREYPDEAKQQGIEGRATVNIQINPDGRLVPLGLRSESHPGFGQACVRALRRSPRWTGPRDRDGQPVAVRSHFICTFELY